MLRLMKNAIFSLFVVSMFPIGLLAQSHSCCSLEATESFAMLGSNESFNADHDVPGSYVHKSEMGQMIEYETTDGGVAQAFELKSPVPTNNYVFVVHEWWGLNNYVKKEAEKLFMDLGNVNVIALDLYDGQVATTRDGASKLMQSVKEEHARAIINGAKNYVGDKARVGTIGWCFGGGWSMQTSLLLGDQAAGCVIYYGMPENKVERIKTLQTDVLGIFATQDKWINPEVVSAFETNMEAAGKEFTTKSFDAKHAFANPSNPQYDSEATSEAYKMTLTFFKERLQ